MTADASAQQHAMAEFRFREKQRYLKNKSKEAEDASTSTNTPNSKPSTPPSPTPAASPAPIAAPSAAPSAAPIAAPSAAPTPASTSSVSSYPKATAGPGESSSKKRSVTSKPKMKEVKVPEASPNEPNVREADTSYSDCLLDSQPEVVPREAMPIRAPTVPTRVMEPQFSPRLQVPNQLHQSHQSHQSHQTRRIPQQAPSQPAPSYGHNLSTWRNEHKHNPVLQHYVTSQPVQNPPSVRRAVPVCYPQHQQPPSQLRAPVSSSSVYQRDWPSTLTHHYPVSSPAVPPRSTRAPTQQSPLMPSAMDLGTREPIEILDDMDQDPELQRALEESLRQFSPVSKRPEELTEEEQIQIILARSQYEK